MKNYSKLVKDVHKQGIAKSSCRRHSRNLDNMKRVANDARELFRHSQGRQRSVRVKNDPRPLILRIF